MRLSRDDFPAFVYPAIATLGIPVRRRLARFVSRDGPKDLICARSLAIRVLMRRRSSSILVSPGPRLPIPAPAPPTWPPACLLIDSPHPRRRGRRYWSCASSTCALPSRVFACWEKMSKMTAVLSITLTLTTSSRARRCEGASSVSATTVSAPTSLTTSASSRALPFPK